MSNKVMTNPCRIFNEMKPAQNHSSTMCILRKETKRLKKCGDGNDRVANSGKKTIGG